MRKLDNGRFILGGIRYQQALGHDHTVRWWGRALQWVTVVALISLAYILPIALIITWLNK